MAFIPLGGKSRRYLDTETGKELSRRQYQNSVKGISFEAKAKANKAADLGKALARPARGRTKASTQTEIENRLEAARIQATTKNYNRLANKAAREAKSVKVKTIRPQLLKTGHRAERIPFSTYAQYEALLKQANTVKAPNGKRLITSYGMGIVGYDERTGKELTATLITLQSPRVKMSEEEFDEETENFIESHSYFIYSHHYLHLHFDTEYAESRLKKARAKNIPKEYRKKK